MLTCRQGTDGYNQSIHIYNNVRPPALIPSSSLTFHSTMVCYTCAKTRYCLTPDVDTIEGHAVDPEVGSSVLVEGNYFNAVTTPLEKVGGAVYFPISEDEASACSSSLGRACIANTVSSDSGEISGSSDSALAAFTDVSPSPLSLEESMR